MKTRSQLHQEISNVYKMIEESGNMLSIAECFKLNGEIRNRFPEFNLSLDEYEPCLAIVEGKPVFKGDELWNIHHNDLISVGSAFRQELAYNYSWNPPKPKTVMVEMDVEVAKKFSRGGAVTAPFIKISKSCAKALKDAGYEI